MSQGSFERFGYGPRESQSDSCCPVDASLHCWDGRSADRHVG
jgi:hypothetical protein